MPKNRENKALAAQLENVEKPKGNSFYVGRFSDKYFRRSWHYHPEYELLLITKGFGTRMVGDHFEKFIEGDLVLLGGNLPHAWISAPHFANPASTDHCESIYIQFKKSVFGTQFIDIPEMVNIRTILKKAERGVKVEGRYLDKIRTAMLQLPALSPLEQMLSLIRMLDWIQRSNYRILASGNYTQQGIFKSEKMTQAHNFIMQNFRNDIDVNRCAEHLGMTTPSFCRFFKQHTNVTFTIYLNYLRINFAQKLLRNTELPIKEIAFECGYVSVVYFNQIFKKMTGMSPREFRAK